MPEAIPAEIRAAEREVDQCHLRNPLMSRPFTEAAWYYLAFCEEMAVKEVLNAGSGELQQGALVADLLVEQTKWPLRWLRRACAEGGQVPDKLDNAMYQASWDLWNLALRYNSFESAFTYATVGITRLELDGRRIRSIPDLREDTQYEAYDRLINPELIPGSPSTERALHEFVDRIAGTIRISGEGFSYAISPQVLRDALGALRPELDWKLKLPGDWQLGRYGLEDFQKVAGVLYALAFIHFQARMIAIHRGCPALGYAGSLIIMTREELVGRLRRYTGLKEATLGAVIEDLTYGARSILQADPALQPLVPVSKSRYCISPNLILMRAAERNLIVLLNRLPEEKKAYSRLSQMREGLTRQKIESGLQGLPFRLWSGKVPGRDDLGDIDLAIISDEERQCLVLELKSFLGPAEVREVIDKSKEIERGIQQTRKRRDAVHQSPEPLRQALGVDPACELTWAVASETFVGSAYVQSPDVPVVRTPHFLRKLKRESSLLAVCEWLNTRSYLPTEEVHYRVVDLEAEIDGWTVPWYGIEPLVEGEYL